MQTVTLTKAPALPRLFAEALLTARRHHGPGLPDTELALHDVTVDRDHLAAYARVCGFRVGGPLPPTYLHVLAFPLQMQLMTDRTFPFPLAKVVHLRNVLVQRRPVDADERPSLRVRAERLAEHSRGAQVDLVAEATVGTEPVWSGRGTYLFRSAEAPAGGPSYDEEPAPEPTLPDRPSAVWQVPADTGRRYAAVSGDVNPIHLHPLAARLAGYPKAIVHGMWTAARVLAAVDSRLPDALVADLTFRKPLLLPSTVELLAGRVDDGWDLGVRSRRDGKVHLTGTVRPPGP